MNTHGITAAEARRLLDEDRRRQSRAHALRRAQRWFEVHPEREALEAASGIRVPGYNQVLTPFGNYTLSELKGLCPCATCELAKVLP